MLLSLALIFLCGMALGRVFEQLKLPRLLGMLITGIVLGPSILNILDQSILVISADLRKIALIIILTRAGLNLDLEDLKKVGRPAILLCFLPACVEIIGVIIIAPKLWNLTILEAAIMGTVIAAVSPAVIVPKMLKLMEEGYGKTNRIPQMIMAGASVDDVFVIVLFTSLTGLAQGQSISSFSFARIPISIISGIALGTIFGASLAYFFRKVHIRDSGKVIIILSISFLFVALEHYLTALFTYSGLIAVMTTGIALQKKRPEVAVRLSLKYSKLWVAAELLLFVLVGATVDVSFALASGITAIILVFASLLCRLVGVWLCLLRTRLSLREKFFCLAAYSPKATVQAAIGSIPLSMGLNCGSLVLTVAVLSILITAPLGAFAIDHMYKKLPHS